MKFSIKEAKFKLTGLSRLGTVLLFNSLDLKFFLRAFREMPLAYKICTRVETYIAKNYVII